MKAVAVQVITNLPVDAMPTEITVDDSTYTHKRERERVTEKKYLDKHTDFGEVDGGIGDSEKSLVFCCLEHM